MDWYELQPRFGKGECNVLISELPIFSLRIFLKYAHAIWFRLGRKYDLWCNSSQGGSTLDMASIIASSYGKTLSRQSCVWEDSTTYAGSTYGSSSFVREEEGLGFATHWRFAWYAVIAAENGMSVSIGLFKGLGEGRIHGFSIWVVQKDTEFNEDEAPPKLDPIIRTGAGQLKFPIRDGYMATPTLPVSS